MVLNATAPGCVNPSYHSQVLKYTTTKYGLLRSADRCEHLTLAEWVILTDIYPNEINLGVSFFVVL